MIKKAAILFISHFLLYSTVCFAQLGTPTEMGSAFDKGVRPYTPYAGVHENINLTNGNVNLAIPLLKLAGRGGLDLNLEMQYDSKIWHLDVIYSPQDPNSSITARWNSGESGFKPFGIDGWRLNIPELTYEATVDMQTSNCYGAAIVRLPDGGRYAFSNNMGCPPPYHPYPPVMDSVDTTAMQLDQSNPNDVVLILRDGTRYHFATNETRIVDANGNIITYTYLNGHVAYITDTLGRQVTLNYNPPDTGLLSSITYKASDGLDKTIQFVNTGTATMSGFFHSPVSCPRCSPPFQVMNGDMQPYTVSGALNGIVFPNGQQYTFAYNNFLELSQITYPSGGYTAYDFPSAPTPTQHLERTIPEVMDITADFREIQRRRVCPKSSCTSAEEQVTTFSPSVGPEGNNSYMSVVDPAGHLAVHAFTQGSVPGDGSDPTAAHETNVSFYAGSTGTSQLLKTVTTNYDGPYTWSLPTQVTTTEYDVNPPLTKQETFAYDTYTALYRNTLGNVQPQTRSLDNVAWHFEYDYNGQLLRQTYNTWLKVNPVNGQDYTSSAIRIMSRKASETVYDGSGNVQAQTIYTYDSTPVQSDLGGAPQHDANYSTSYSTRGNLTQVQHWLNPGNTYVTTATNYYDDLGNLRQSTDANGNSSYFDYGNNSDFNCFPSSSSPQAWVTQTTNALGQHTQTRYFGCTGLVGWTRDQNDINADQNNSNLNRNHASFTYDAINRVTQVTYADTGQITNCYTDSGPCGQAPAGTPYKVVSTESINSSVSPKTTTSVFDGLGRVVQTQLNSDPDGVTYVDTAYDALGRVQSVSNPYRSTTESTYGLTQHQYDALGRETTLTEPDGGTVTTNYAQFPSVTVTDEAGKQRRNRADAMGRLVQVDEPYALTVPGTQATGSISILGENTTGDSGTVYISVSGSNNLYYLLSLQYDPSSDAHGLAYWFAVDFNSDPASPVTAAPIDPYSTDHTLYLTSKATGAAANYHISTAIASNSGSSPFGFDIWDQNLTGGTDGVTYPPSLSTPAVTLYSYDALDNLVHVEQHGNDSNSANWRQRNFQYDSLSRLVSATNPESGTITYSYDNAGNLKTKTAPLPNQYDANVPVSTYFNYDALNRPTLKWFSDTSRSTQYFYDQSPIWGVNVQNPIGRLVGTYTVLPNWTTLDGSSGGGGVGSTLSYDAMGRVAQEEEFNQHVLPFPPAQFFNYTYNLDGSLNSVQYPAVQSPTGRTVTYRYNAAGQPVSAQDLDNNISYVTNAHYTAAGALSSLDNGSAAAGIHTSNTYNSRLQPITLTAMAGTNVVFNLGYDFHLGNGDNGNVIGVANYRAFDHSRDQSFTYDQLNRLTSAQSAATSGTNCWGEGYGYDAWGNMTSRNVTKCTGEGAIPGADSNNRMAGYGYDAAGNLTQWGFAYNSENRLIQAPLANLKFDYDDAGRRVEKSNGTLYWYGAGNVLEETNLSGALKAEYIFFGGKRIARRDPTGAVHYYFADHLGSTDIVTNATGTVVEEESEYYPFGGERGIIDTGIGNNYKFTSKERDPEDGLDNLGARYYTWYFSRFTTPDWSEDPEPVPYADLEDPQSLNQYTYVRNTPTVGIDPDGHFMYVDTRCWVLCKVNSVPSGQEVFMKMAVQMAMATATAIAATENFFSSNKKIPPPPIPTNLQGAQQATPADPNQQNEDQQNKDKKAGRDQKKSEWQRLTNKEATQLSQKLGYDKEVTDPPFKSHGAKVFTNGQNYITADQDGHNGGVWKMFNKAGDRIGTYNADLTTRLGN
jgi:RHS repeat-associated protein